MLAGVVVVVVVESDVGTSPSRANGHRTHIVGQNWIDPIVIDIAVTIVIANFKEIVGGCSAVIDRTGKDSEVISYLLSADMANSRVLPSIRSGFETQLSFDQNRDVSGDVSTVSVANLRATRATIAPIMSSPPPL